MQRGEDASYLPAAAPQADTGGVVTLGSALCPLFICLMPPNPREPLGSKVYSNVSGVTVGEDCSINSLATSIGTTSFDRPRSRLQPV